MAGTPRHDGRDDPRSCGAAMEPALEWREHRPLAVQTRPRSSAPQWSPPWNGGNTATIWSTVDLLGGAAMEPALEWREHPPLAAAESDQMTRRNGARLGMAGTRRAPRQRTSGILAAMEPALEWREHHAAVPGRPVLDLPQWSPPWNGGNTGLRHWRADRRRACRNGARLGMAGTRRRGTSRSACTGAAMEPALEWREHPRRTCVGKRGQAVPQWSPPWNGGNTPQLPGR